ncbi:MAG: hypothetical protein ACYTG3_14995 [Planctomycetota bacterium]|jgi:hypothetical protein
MQARCSVKVNTFPPSRRAYAMRTGCGWGITASGRPLSSHNRTWRPDQVTTTRPLPAIQMPPTGSGCERAAISTPEGS